MTYIKICGITSRDDAHAAIDSGADALGFIAVPESPRFVAAFDFQRIREVLPPSFPIIVVVKRPTDAERYHAPIVQFYQEGCLADSLAPETLRIKVFRVKDSDDILQAQNPGDGVHATLLDANHAALLGGSGTRFDWSLTHPLRADSKKPFILAGGFKPSNVTQALTEVQPYAVDVSSGVEDDRPGVKSHDLIAKFIAAVRAWDEEFGSFNHGPFLGYNG